MQLLFRYRIYPSTLQKEFLAKQFGCCRFVYNHFLNLCGKDKSIKPNYKLMTLLPALKQKHPFLQEASSVALQQSIMNLLDAYINFFKRRNKHPKFKTKHDKQSFRLVGKSPIFSIRAGGLYLSKMPGLVKIKLDRPLPSNPTSVIVTLNRSGQYHASFVCEANSISLPSNKSIGIDLGIKDFCITSSGDKFDNPRYFVTSEKRLARLQRRLARKQKGSNNRNKAKLKVAQLHQHIVNQRNDFLHKLSTALIRENQVICVEDLNASGMMRNRRLAKHIADVSWGKFCTFLMYKAERYQRQLMIMNTFTPSTQTCSMCYVQRNIHLTLNERSWICNHCGAEHDRDVNAARVIHSVGIQYWYKERNNLATLMLVPRWKNGVFIV